MVQKFREYKNTDNTIIRTFGKNENTAKKE